MTVRKPLLYFLALLPGLGHMYLGLMTRGLHFMLLFFGTIFTVANSFGGLALLLPVIFFYSYFDALHYCRLDRDMLEGFDEPLFSRDWLHKNRRTFGWVLIGIGCLVVMKQVTYYLPQWIPAFIPYDLLQNIIISGVLVLIGFQLLREKEEEWEV